MFVPGKPEPLHRHRARVVSSAGKKPFVQIYPDKRSADYEDLVAMMVRKQSLQAHVVVDPTLPPSEFLLPFRDCRILMTVRFNLVKPPSYPKRVTAHTKKPDVDNYAKAVLDGLVKGLVIADDGMVTDLTTYKRYVCEGHPEGVEIDLTAVPTEVV